MADGRIEIDTKIDSKGAEKGISNLKSKLEGVGTKMKSVGGGMSTMVTAPLLASLGVATKGTEEFRGDLSKLEQNARDAGMGTDVVRDSMVRLAGVSNETDSNVEALSNLLATGFDEQGLVQTMDALSGAVIKFPDTLKIEGLADGLQETLATGKAIGPFAELLDRLGISQDTFNQGLAEAKAKGEEQNYILQTLANTGLSQVNEGYRKNNEELVKSQESQQKFQQSLADLGTTLQPIMTSITNLFQKLIEKFNSLSPTAQTVIIVIATIAAAIGPLLVVAGSLVTVIGAVGAAMLGWVALGAVVVAAIAALVIAIVTHWGDIKAKTIQIWGAVKDWLIGAWQVIKKTAVDVFNAVKTFLSSVWTNIKATISSIVNGLVNAIQTAWNNFRSNTQGIFSSLKQILSGIWQGIKNVVVGAALLLVDLLTGNFRGLKSDAIAIFNNLKSAAATIWNGIKSLVSGIVSGFVSFVKTQWNNLKSSTSSAFNRIKSLASTVWNGIKNSISTIVNAIKNAVSSKFNSLKNAVSDKMNAAKRKITSIWESAQSFLENIDLFEIGSNIIQGLINGIGSLAGKVTSKIKEIANSVPDWARKILGIASPSKVMRQLGEWTLEGFGLGMGDGQKYVSKEQKEMLKSFEESNAKILDEMLYQNQRIKNARKQLAENEEEATDELKAVANQQLYTQREINKAQLDNMKAMVDRKKELNEVSIADEVSFYREMYQEAQFGTEQYYEAEKLLRDSKKALNQEIQSINEEHLSKTREINNKLVEEEEKLTQEYKKAVDDRTKELYTFSGIFDEITKDFKGSGLTLMKNLKDQVNTFSDWSNNIADLAKRGVSDGLLNELKMMGPKAAEEIKALTQLSDAQLEEYQDLWKQKNKLAREQAVGELQGLKEDTSDKIEQLRSNTNDQLEQIRVDWVTKIAEVRTGVEQEFSTMKSIGENAVSQLEVGMDNMHSSLVSKARRIASDVRRALDFTLQGASINLPGSANISNLFAGLTGANGVQNPTSNRTIKIDKSIKNYTANIDPKNITEINDLVRIFDTQGIRRG